MGKSVYRGRGCLLCARLITVFIIPLLVFLSACGSSGNGNDTGTTHDTPDNPVAEVRIEQSAVLLTEINNTAQLTAVVYDKLGNKLNKTVTWSSSDPSHVQVNDSGTVVAISIAGSSRITATAEGVISIPLLVVSTEVTGGSILISDEQIIGEPFDPMPPAGPGDLVKYKVMLSGNVSLKPGDVLINRGSKAVAGRVEEVVINADQITVTLSVPPLREVFPNLEINQTFDLAQVPLEIADGLDDIYEIQRVGNVTTFTLKPSPGITIASITPATQATSLGLPGIFKCELEFTDTVVPVQFSIPPLISIEPSLSHSIVHTAEHGLERFVIKGDVKPSINAGITVTAAVQNAVKCEVKLGSIPLPISGAFGPFIGAKIDLSAGVSAGGKLTVVTAGFDMNASFTASAELGVDCPGGTDCSLVNTADISNSSVKPTLNLPSLGDIRFEPELMAYGLADLVIGIHLFDELQFSMAKAQLGLKLQGSFALRESQIAATDYASNYKVLAQLEAGVGPDLSKATEYLGLGTLSAFALNASINIASTPTGSVTADKAKFDVGDTVNVTVNLKPDSVDFLPIIGPYNVSKVVIAYNSPTLFFLNDVASVDAAAGQTKFDLAFVATEAGNVQDLSAFIVTTLLPFDLASLEIGQASAVVSGVEAVLLSRIARVAAYCEVTVTRADSDGGNFQFVRAPEEGVVTELSESPPTPQPVESPSAGRICDKSLEGARAASDAGGLMNISELYSANSVADELGALSGLIGLSASTTTAAGASVSLPGGDEDPVLRTTNARSITYGNARFTLYIPDGVTMSVTANIEADLGTRAIFWTEVNGERMEYSLCPALPVVEDFSQWHEFDHLCEGDPNIITRDEVLGPFIGPLNVTLESLVESGWSGSRTNNPIAGADETPRSTGGTVNFDAVFSPTQ